MYATVDPNKPNPTLPFGMHKGKRLSAIPTDYLSWLLRATKLSSGLRVAVEAELHARHVHVPAKPQHSLPPCRSCGACDPAFSWQTGRSGTRLIRVECKGCGSFQRFAPQVEPYTTLANSAPDKSNDARLVAAAVLGDAEARAALAQRGVIVGLPGGSSDE